MEKTKAIKMKFLGIKQVLEITGLSRTSVWRFEKNGDFPKRRQLGPRRVGYVDSEISNWMESRSRVTPNDNKPGH